jgi:hypothetical protein
MALLHYSLCDEVLRQQPVDHTVAGFAIDQPALAQQALAHEAEFLHQPARAQVAWVDIGLDPAQAQLLQL